MDFKEKLNLLMEWLNASNTDIAEKGSFDRTNLSHYRNGKRVPSGNTRIAEKLMDGLYFYARDTGKLQALCEVTEARQGLRRRRSGRHSRSFSGTRSQGTTVVRAGREKSALPAPLEKNWIRP